MGDVNLKADRLTCLAVRPIRHILPERTNYTFMSLYHPHFPDNVES
jgi:hypothetical protein